MITLPRREAPPRSFAFSRGEDAPTQLGRVKRRVHATRSGRVGKIESAFISVSALHPALREIADRERFRVAIVPYAQTVGDDLHR
jgi:hypothetical protein